jgi:hypothetical protein
MPTDLCGRLSPQQGKSALSAHGRVLANSLDQPIEILAPDVVGLAKIGERGIQVCRVWA